MKICDALVVENERLYGETVITWLRAPEISAGATPGQFVMIRCTEDPSSLDPLLPRPMSIHRLRSSNEGLEFAILYNVVGRGTAWLAKRRPGETMRLWGPLGHGFAPARATRNLLMVAGGIGVAPLVWLADEAVAAGRAVTLVAGARNACGVFPSHLLPAEVEVIATTEDGSAGRRGLATDAFVEHLAWADEVFACGPEPMFREMARIVRGCEVRRPVQALLEARMGCGTGICYGCAVETKAGRGRTAMKLVCKDGPRFELRKVY